MREIPATLKLLSITRGMVKAYTSHMYKCYNLNTMKTTRRNAKYLELVVGESALVGQDGFDGEGAITVKTKHDHHPLLIRPYLS